MQPQTLRKRDVVLGSAAPMVPEVDRRKPDENTRDNGRRASHLD